MYRFLFILIASLSLTQLKAQITIANGLFETCGGAFFDTGGQGGPGYSNGEYIVCTICPDVPGDIITMDFITFSLDQSGPQNSWDNMAIYDGDNVNEGSLGVYVGNELEGFLVSATSMNTSGCLTIVFQSNNLGTGNFAASLTCGTPCQRPEANATYDAPANRRICVGDVINFDGTGSFAAPGFVIDEYIWDFADGVTDNSGPTVSHSWDEPGEYVIELYLTDDNGCASTNRVSLQVLVSTYPAFIDFPGDQFLCLGQELTLSVDPNQQEVTWSGPEQVYANTQEFELPDEVGTTNDIPINVSGFGPGQVLNNINDLLDFTITIEHSWLFDLVIELTCPSGQSVVLHQQMLQADGSNVNANGTDFGVANTTAWDYSWAANATLGTIAQEASAGGGGSLPSDTYTSLEPMNQLVGCDLNGTWTLSISDLWGGDDGTIFNAALNFNPAILPDVTEFTPQIGVSLDSSYWVLPVPGPPVLNYSADGNTVSILPDQTGSWAFSYEMINNHGCAFDSSFTVNVTQTLASAGEDLVWCGPGTILTGGVGGLPTPVCSDDAGDYSYCYGDNDNSVFTYCQDNPGDGYTSMGVLFTSGFIEVFFDDITIYDGDNTGAPVLAGPLDGDISGLQFIATNPEGCITFRITSDGLFSCSSGAFAPMNYTVGCNFGGPDMVYSWSPATGLSDANVQYPEVSDPAVPTTYTLTVYPPGRPECAETDEVVVSPGYVYSVDFLQPECFEPVGEIYVEIDPATGTAPWEIIIQQGSSILQSATSYGGTTTFVGLMPDVYEVFIDNGVCQRTEIVDMAVPPVVTVTASPDVTICVDGTADLSVVASSQPAGIVFNWSNNQQGATINVGPLQDTEYFVYGTFGTCFTDTSYVTVSVRDSLSLSISSGETICQGDSLFLGATLAEGGLEPYTFTWQGDGISFSAQSFYAAPNSTTTYCCTITDACETPAIELCSEVVISPLVDPTFAVDTLGGCRPVLVDFQGLAINPEIIETAMWDFGDGATSSLIHTASHTYTTQGLYDITYSIVTIDGCFYESTQTDLISIYNWPIAGFQLEPQTAVMPHTDITFENASFGATELQWIVSELDTLYGVDPIYTFPNNTIGSYPVQLVASNEWGCTDTTLRYAVVIDEFVMYIPNAFTPDQDGVNDVFRFEGIDVDKEDFTFQVFNRWGEVVFETKIFEQGWDGSFQGGDYYVPDGMYVYRVETKSITSQERKEIIGTVLIVR
ncbi:MAG: PKD domain-containing protein [Cryomorphaceae bacterium]|nr:PKD domain-containing protein [Cryomorphaceae bacterium]